MNIDKLLAQFDIESDKEIYFTSGKTYQDHPNFDEFKQALNLYIEERERKARLGEVKLAHHVIFPDLGVLTPDLIDNYLLDRIKELEG